jgi:glycosyltransferase involved in cell wall biosynthesis
MPEPASVPAPFLSVVVPFYNEADNAESMVGEVVAALRRYRGDWELLCVDDGSEDGTAQRLERAAGPWGDQVRVLRLRRNFGQTAALQAGIDASRGELIATLDGDRQNDPADLPRMVEELLERDLDLLAGWRRNRQDGYFLRLLPSRIANLLIRRVTGVRIRDYGSSRSGSRALHRHPGSARPRSITARAPAGAPSTVSRGRSAWFPTCWPCSFS